MFCLPKWNGCFGTVPGEWRNGRYENDEQQKIII